MSIHPVASSRALPAQLLSPGAPSGPLRAELTGPHSHKEANLPGDTPAVSQEREEGNTFRKTDDKFWEVIYEGKKSHVQHIKGMSLLAHLLRCTRQQFSGLQLSALIDGDGSHDADSKKGTLYEASEDAGCELSVGRSDADEDLDPRARKEILDRLHELAVQRDKAEAENDKLHLKEIDQETEAIKVRHDRATGLGWKDRGFTTIAGRARPRVKKLIVRAIKNITKDNPQLGTHLEVTIKTGYSCTYNPDPTNPINWEF